jgi:hypothetical protein
MSIFKKRVRVCKAIFSVSIDTNHDYQSNTDVKPKSLEPSGKYCFGEDKLYATYEDLREFAISILNTALLDECKQFIGIPIHDIEVKGIYDGSIDLFVIVRFGVTAGVTGVRDLHDSIEFLKVLAKKALKKHFREKYGDYFRIDVNRNIPRDIPHWDDFKSLYKHQAIPAYSVFNGERPISNGFFCYLVISNIVLLVIIIALVLGAVTKTYFSEEGASLQDAKKTCVHTGSTRRHIPSGCENI